jgi:cysteine desulfurase family protein
MARIYLDNAATSWPKPEAVYTAVDDYQRRLGAPAGRSSYAEAAETERIVVSCRKKIAQLIGADDPTRVIFTHNGTDSLNLGLHGVLRPGDHVVTSVCEHNSVLRPLRFLAKHRDVAVSYVGCNREGYIDPDDIEREISPKTRLIALIHASNVTGAIQPVQEVGRIAAERGILYLVDAAQSLGHVALDVKSIGCHLLAAPGHKGLCGPLGSGILYVAPGAEKELLPLRQGGTGTRSDEDVQPDSLPDRYESGNLNVPAIAGLEAGVDSVVKQGAGHDSRQTMGLVEPLLAALSDTGGVQLYGPPSTTGRVGVVSLNVAGYDPQELASLLDAHWSIQTRAGLHCAPRMHAALGTGPLGTLRVSPGHFNTPQEVETLIRAIAEVASG